MIKIPDWLSVDILTEIKAKESDDETFYELPFHYIEIAFSLLNTAKEEIEEPDKVKSLVKDIMTIRMDRTRIGLLGLSKAAENAEVIRCIGVRRADICISIPLVLM